jgi:hypothetical protein
MKRKNIRSLALNKKSISNFSTPAIKGGTFISISCQPLGICAQSDGCATDDCNNTNGCATNACTVNCPPSNQCPTISCQPKGICR